MAFLGVDVGGTFTDAVLLGRRTACARRRCRPPRGRRSPCSRRREAAGRDKTSSASRTGRRSRRTRCSSASGARTAFVATAGFEHLLHLRRQDRAPPLPARAPTTRSRSSRSSAATASASAIGPDGVLEPLDLDVAARLSTPRRSRSASSSRSATRSMSGRSPTELRRRLPGGARRRLARGRAGVPRVRARVDHGRRRVPRPRSRRATSMRLATQCDAARAARAARDALVRRRRGARGGCRARSVRAPRAGPAGGRDRSGPGRRGSQASRTRSPSTWAAPRRMCALILGGAPARGSERPVGGLPDPAAGARPPYGWGRRWLTGLARHGRGGPRGAAERRRHARAGLLRTGQHPGHRHRCEPSAGKAAAASGGRLRTRCRRREPRAGRRRSGRCRRGRERRDAARAARGLGRARHRPARHGGSSPSAGAGRSTPAPWPESLEIGRVLVPAAAGVLSALGLVAADERHDQVEAVVVPLADAVQLPAEGEADVRYAGQSFELTVPLGGDIADAFPPGARAALRLRRQGAAARARRGAHGRDSARSTDRAQQQGTLRPRPGCGRARGRDLLGA